MTGLWNSDEVWLCHTRRKVACCDIWLFSLFCEWLNDVGEHNLEDFARGFGVLSVWWWDI